MSKRTETRAQEIKRLCEEKGLTVAEVLRHANVSSVTMHNWEKQDPRSFQMYDDIMSSIETLATDKVSA